MTSILTVNSRKARENLRDLLDRVFKGDTDIIIERNGKPVAAMISVTDYEDILDELEDLRSSRRAAEIYESWKRDSTTARPLNEVEADLLDRGLLE